MIEDEPAAFSGEEPEQTEGARELRWHVWDEANDTDVYATLRDGEWRITLMRGGQVIGSSDGQDDILAALYMADPNAGGEWAEMSEEERYGA